MAKMTLSYGGRAPGMVTPSEEAAVLSGSVTVQLSDFQRDRGHYADVCFIQITFGITL